MEEQLVMRINEILESNKIDDRDKKHIADLLSSYKCFRHQLLSAYDNGFVNKAKIKDLLKRYKKQKENACDIADHDSFMFACGGIFALEQLLKREVYDVTDHQSI